MSAIELARLERVDLRSVFPKEAAAFTPWLANEENLALLGDTIGLDLELVAQEKEVGPFRADILCKNTETDEWVLVENQIEKTDHNHLGQILTYAAGLDAVTIVWIAASFTDQHVAALEWLNEKTNGTIRFFGLEIELWRIGNSPPAPKFNIRSKPNDFVKSVQSATGDVALSEVGQLQQRFWTEFFEYIEKSKSPVKCRKPGPHRWMHHPIGIWAFHLSSTLLSDKNGADGPKVRVGLTVNGEKRFRALEKLRGVIDQKLGADLVWESTEGQKICRIYRQRLWDFTDENTWPELREWLKGNLEDFQRVFVPIIQGLDQAALKES
ncbi:MAG: DUF4268 domain-containing protein [Terracidiphilus sp.]